MIEAALLGVGAYGVSSLLVGLVLAVSGYLRLRTHLDMPRLRGYTVALCVYGAVFGLVGVLGLYEYRRRTGRTALEAMLEHVQGERVAAGLEEARGAA